MQRRVVLRLGDEARVREEGERAAEPLHRLARARGGPLAHEAHRAQQLAHKVGLLDDREQTADRSQGSCNR